MHLSNKKLFFRKVLIVVVSALSVVNDTSYISWLYILGDGMAEVWSNSSECQNLMSVKSVKDTHYLQQYFVSKVSRILAEEGLSMAVFEDVLRNENALLNVTQISPNR